MEAEAKAAAAAEPFATPDREITTASEPPQKSEKKQVPSAEAELNTVTPLDAEGDKQVRFDNDEKEEKDSKRGLVSRRGGRLGSPAAPPRATVTTKEAGPVLEFKTYRSPTRKRDSAVENDTIPSLCSTNSGSLERKAQENKDGGNNGDSEKPAADSSEAKASPGQKETGRPSSISCDPSMIATTSPLASQDVDASPSGQARKSAVATTPTKPSALPSAEAEPRNVTFSPPTPHSEVRAEMPKKTPTKSPPTGQFQSLPSLHDAKLTSPSGIFLEPASPSGPSGFAGLSSVPSFEKDAQKGSERQKSPDELKNDGDENKKLAARPEGMADESEHNMAARARDQERERIVATPTDFSLDFGKGLRPTGSFDASNVLAWLQSPTANGLFSPGGGLGSALNTPRAPAAPRTPRTPTNTTSFFFSDVASLPKSSEFVGSPKGDNAAGKRGGPQGVYSSMICISPVAPKNRKSASEPQTPMNYNDVFASPRANQEQRPGNLPFLGESPSKRHRSRSKKDGSVDAHMAERDLMEDEDLSVLLQLASHSGTPGRSRDGGHVFRSPQHRQASGYPPSRQDASGSNLPGLQLPVIGGRGDGGAKLSRKPGSRDHPGAPSDDFKPPQLAIRSSSSGGSKDIYFGGAKASGKDDKGKPPPNPGGGERKKSAGTQKPGRGPAATKKNSRKTPTYAMPPYVHPGEQPMSYYPMPGTIPGMPPGGSMRVVVGAPPPMPPSARPKNKGSPSRMPGSPSRRPPYPMHPADGRYPGMPYPPHHAHGPYPPPHTMGLGMPPPYPGHYPPPPHHPAHLPMYPHHPVPAETTKKVKGKAKAGGKRPPTHPGKAPAKKARKSPSKTSKKRRTSTSSSGPAERQKTAQKIQAVNAASGGKNDRAASLAAAILRGVTMRPSGKWQAQLYYAGKSRYIGVFDTREKAALAYEIAREKLKQAEKMPNDNSAQSLKATEAAVNLARKAAFEGVNEKDPRNK